MIKQFLSALLCLAVIILVSLTAKADELPEVTSAGFVLCNAESGEIMESKNAGELKYPASLTKLMTALLTVEMANDLDTEIVTVSRSAVDSLAGTRSSTGNLKVGESYSLRQLLYLLLLPSANDSANVLAEHFCTTNEMFVEKMNKRAAQLGMKDTHFVNPHGLHDEDHYTTPRDMALLATAFLKEPALKEITATAEYTIPATDLQEARVVKTSNLMRLKDSEYYYADAYGLKTGNTDEAGRCLVAAAERNGLNLICILMNCPARYTRTSVIRCEFLEAASIFDYAFESYAGQKLATKGQMVVQKRVGKTLWRTEKLVLQNSVFATLPKNADVAMIEQRIKWNAAGKAMQAPIQRNAEMGTVEFILNGKVVAQTALLAEKTINPNLILVFWNTIDSYVYIVALVFFGLLLLFLALVVRAQTIKRRRRKRRARRAARG